MVARGRFRSVHFVLTLAILAVGHPAFAQVDLSGEWSALLYEDVGHRLDAAAAGGPFAGPGVGGPRVGDYTGLPINGAARLKAESWDPRINNAREHQMILQPGAYWVLSPGAIRISKIVNEATEATQAFRIHRSGIAGATTRMIWMDGRPHPPAYAAHSWWGFSTGTWDGDVLTVHTTHLKAGWIRRNGVPSSDQATVTERFVRHGGYLTVIRILNDPIYLEEPFVITASWLLNPRQQLVAPTAGSIVDEIPGQSAAFVPHYLPEANNQLKEFAQRFGLPFEATRGGKETAYPEYQRTMKAMPAARPKTGTQ